MYSSDRRVLIVVGLLVFAIVATTAVAVVARRGEDGSALGATPRPRLRLERDTSRGCVPPDPARTERCDPLRQTLWDNRNGELITSLRGRGISNPTTADILAAYLEMHTEAGDLAVIEDVAQRLGRPEVRVVAIGLAPEEPSREYVEVRNVGGTAARLDGWTLPAPDGGHPFRFSPAEAFPGVLEPGQSCRVYTVPAGQWNACAGAWDQPSAGTLWSEDGGWVMLRNAANTESDRWWYRP